MAAEADEPVTGLDPGAGCTLTITFGGPMGVDPAIRAEHVTPGQLFAAAFFLDCLAREVRAGQVTRDALGGIMPPPADLLAQLRRAGRV